MSGAAGVSLPQWSHLALYAVVFQDVMTIFSVDGLEPSIAATSYVAESAEVIGDVTLHEKASVWPKVVIRGDSEAITIGAESNVQVIHTRHAKPIKESPIVRTNTFFVCARRNRVYCTLTLASL